MLDTMKFEYNIKLHRATNNKPSINMYSVHDFNTDENRIEEMGNFNVFHENCAV